MYLWGLDLSMERSGITIFDLHTYNPVYITSIQTNKKESHGKRLYDIATTILQLKEKYPPSEIAIERGFNRFNTATSVIYRVHGLVNYLFYDINQTYYPPKSVKESIIKGDATKKLLREIIENTYPDIEFHNEDESDSFAVGITYLIKNNLIEWDKSMLIKNKR